MSSKDPQAQAETKHTPTRVLQKALELFGPNGEHWGKGQLHRRGRYCALGALWLGGCPDDSITAAVEALSKAIGSNEIGNWNDSHNFRAVKAAFKRAINNCQQAEGIQP